jgi:short-chain fatty acids transporter
LSFLLHGTVSHFKRGTRESHRLGLAVVIHLHLYAGVAGLIQFTTVGEWGVCALMASISSQYTFHFFAALIRQLSRYSCHRAAAQWAIQGFISAKVALSVGVTGAARLLATSIGDHMGNLIAPFWYMVDRQRGASEHCAVLGTG